MWNIFVNKSYTFQESFENIDSWKKIVFEKENIEVKKYFAEKISLYFDYLTLFKKYTDLHDALLTSLAEVEKDSNGAQSVFPDIKCFLMPENKNTILITQNLKNKEYFPKEYTIIEENAILNLEKIKKLKNQSWENLIFSIEISDFSIGWIEFTPNLQERASNLVRYVLTIKEIALKNLSLEEKIELEKNIFNHEKYQEYYDKVIKFMPRVEQMLEKEWKESVIDGSVPKIKIKKTKMK